MVTLLTLLVCSAAFSQHSWPMFRHDSTRTGYVEDTTNPGNPPIGTSVLGMHRPTPIWIYPVVQPGWQPIDNLDPVPAFDSSGDWDNTPINAISPYGDDYLFTTSDGTGSRWARWSFDFDSGNTGTGGLPNNHHISSSRASFWISIWVPAVGNMETVERTTDAHYTIEINGTAVGSAILDQSSGGAWQVLGYRPFTVHDGDILSVTLANRTEVIDEFTGNPVARTVIADAMWLEQDSGEIMSSPVACDNPDTAANPDANVLLTCSSSLMSFGGQSRYLGWITGLGTEVNSGIDTGAGLPADDRGIMKWQYPAEDRNWISYGISSTPAIYRSVSSYLAIIPAADGQVYYIDPARNYPNATIPALDNVAIPTWQGPGYTLRNPTPSPPRDGTQAWVVGAQAGFQQANPADDPYYEVRAIAPVAAGSESDRAEATWTQAVNPRESRDYRVEVWIPPSDTARPYVNDARYTVLLDTGGSQSKTNLRINQQNGGTWISLGDYHITDTSSGTITVTLNNETNLDQTATTYWVVADAVRIIPADIGSFEYSSPCVAANSDIFIGSKGGRVYRLAMNDPEPLWTFPKPDQQPIGAIYASITESGGFLYVGSADGHLYKIDETTGVQGWVYPDINADPPQALAEISSTAAFGDNIYIATGGWHGGQMPGWNSAEGRIICIKDDPMAGPQLQWVYPAASSSPVGAFLYASPLWMTPTASNPAGVGVYLGSTDGYFYGVDALGDPGNRITTPAVGWPTPPRVDIGDTITSSAAGTRIEFPTLDPVTNVQTARLGGEIGAAFVGAGSDIQAVDLSTGTLEGWHWGLMGSTMSSPALYRRRIYTGDMAGYAWAFSTGDAAGGGAAEGWNAETGMTGPPTTGSEGEDDTANDWRSRQAAPNIDVFSKEDYEKFLEEAKISRNEDATGHPVNPTAIDSSWNDPSTHADHSQTIHEWGEDIYIIVWGILDPNDRYKIALRQKPDGSISSGVPPFVGDIEGGHQIEITIKSREPGRNADSTDVKRVMGKQIDWYQDSTDYAVWYAAYVYVLDGSSSSNPQTPGSTINIGVRETPISPDRKSELIWVGTDSSPTTDDPIPFTINNPLGIVYSGPYGTSTINKTIGMLSATTTSKGASEAPINGNSEWPIVWGGITPHNRPSQARPVTIYDRSLLGANRNPAGQASRAITKFRVERHGLRWTGVGDFNSPQCPAVNPIAVWEMAPQDQRLNRPNISPDYPNISVRQVATNMTSGGQDPSQAPQRLTPENDQMTFNVPPPPTWIPVENGMTALISVPRFQPANLPPMRRQGDSCYGPQAADWPTADELGVCGYQGEMIAYVDSNGNGVFDAPAALGMAAAHDHSSEAYRGIAAQVHVPVDRRVELGPERVNLGELPHGFGYTHGSPMPFAFLDALAYNTFLLPTGSLEGHLSPPGFAEWFQLLQAKNTGNTNLLALQVARTDLISDTVERPFRDPTYAYWNPAGLLVGSGHSIPATCVLTNLDGRAVAMATQTALWGNGLVDKFPVSDRFGFLSSVPPVPGLDSTMRTSNKPRVGGEPANILVPDVPDRLVAQLAGSIHIPNGPKPEPQSPAIGVAIPLGQPAGTYYGKVRLWDMSEDTAHKVCMTPVSNPIEIVAKTTEGRLTDGYTLNAAPHLSHLDPMMSPGTGDAMPAAFRDRVTGNIDLYWTSSRYGPTIVPSSSAVATASDPWYLYRSTLATAQPGYEKPGNWIEPTGNPQWWIPTNSTQAFPNPLQIANYFPGPPLGASGTVIPGSVKFSSPATAVDESPGGKAWLLFTGQAYKDDPSMPSDKRRTLESRVYYADVVDGAPGTIYSTSPKPSTSTANIAGDWPTPKFGVRGTVLKRGSASELWCFWYGGNADRWRIYYNANATPADPTKWTNEAPLPLPKGLSSAAEPSPIAWWRNELQTTDFVVDNGQTYCMFDLVYSAYSASHKNSDIYLSRYKTDPIRATASKGGHWPVTLQLLPQRTVVKTLDVNGNPIEIIRDDLTRDATRGIWYSRDVDWDSQIVSFSDKPGPPPVPPSFEVYVKPGDPTVIPTGADPDGDGILRLNVGAWTKDTTSGAIAFEYNANALPTGTPPAIVTEVTALRTLFRAVVIDPAEGTVKFLRPPESKALVSAKYRPKAYRLTDDPAADTSPCAIADYYNNLRYVKGDPDGNPFIVPSGWNTSLLPPTDRLWVFWRRPGVGICYKTFRYMVQLDHQMALKPNTYEPAVGPIVGNTYPVEVDWTKNRLYFTAPDSVTTGSIPVPSQVSISYTDAAGNPRTETHFIEMVEEEMGPSGKTFGNLSNLTVNESQVSAFKDPWDNKVWVFWTSTRSGNPDLYYETVSPMFTGTRFTASSP